MPLSRILSADPGFWLSPGFSLIGYRKVSPERFKSEFRAPSDDQIGTYEVMYSHADDAVDTRGYIQSLFLRREQGRWIVVSIGYWEDRKISRSQCTKPEGSDARRYCDLRLGVEPWPEEFEKFRRDIEPLGIYN